LLHDDLFYFFVDGCHEFSLRLRVWDWTDLSCHDGGRALRASSRAGTPGLH
jgi:hypothetical protein